MKSCTRIGPSLACECGARFQAMDAFQAHQGGCILSRCGAAKAVKRRFEEIAASSEGDRAGAAVQALGEVASAARGKLCLTCAGCGGPFGNVDSLARHKRKFAH